MPDFEGETLRQRVEAVLEQHPRINSPTKICNFLRIDPKSNRSKVHRILGSLGQVPARRNPLGSSDERKARSERLKSEMANREFGEAADAVLRDAERILASVNPDDPASAMAALLKASLLTMAQPGRLQSASLKDLLAISKEMFAMLHPAPAQNVTQTVNVSQAVGILSPAATRQRLEELRRKALTP